ncbi:MAG: hypothetical protein ACRYFX_32115 [Janthinobacterium lividum]
MAFPVSLLPTRAQCEVVLTSLRQEKRVLDLQNQTTDLHADQAGDRATTRATDLADAQASVTQLTPVVAGLTPGSRQYLTMNRMLTQATRRVQDLTTPTTTAADPAAAFLKAVDVRQIEVQLPELDAAIAEVTTHRDTLPV